MTTIDLVTRAKIVSEHLRAGRADPGHQEAAAVIECLLAALDLAEADNPLRRLADDVEWLADFHTAEKSLGPVDEGYRARRDRANAMAQSWHRPHLRFEDIQVHIDLTACPDTVADLRHLATLYPLIRTEHTPT